MTATARDLAELARKRRQPVPPLLASTMLVEILAAIAAGHRRGRAQQALDLEHTVLDADSLAALLADPSRDPKVRLAAASRPCRSSAEAAEDVAAAAELAADLLDDAAPPPAELVSLLSKMRDPVPAARPSAAAAHAEARAIALEQFARVERRRRGPRLEERLRRALDAGRPEAVEELAAELGEVAPSSLMLAAAHRWLGDLDRHRAAVEAARRRLAAELYARRRQQVARRAEALAELLGDEAGADLDLGLARGWLAELRREDDRRRARRHRDSLKLVLTGAPLVLATLLSGLLMAVIVWA